MKPETQYRHSSDKKKNKNYQNIDNPDVNDSNIELSDLNNANLDYKALNKAISRANIPISNQGGSSTFPTFLHELAYLYETR
mmetsp:Transcript_26963/g.23846  ORF Transcript_26963/g.23846 Transcript_26963/m.23846 type:complete len:82 (+) Transcript_26963:1062-1307(+)